MNRTAWLIAAVAGILLAQGFTRCVRAQSAGVGTQAVPPQATPAATAPAEDRSRNSPATASDRQPDEFVILNKAGDFNEFLRKFNQPDWVFMRPGVQGTTAATAAAEPRPAARTHVVNGVKIRGRVDKEFANLRVELDLALLVPGAAWVPLGIRSQVVTSAREGDHELQLRSLGQGQWDVRMEGPGPHRVVLDLKRPLKVNPDRTQLDLAIPEAPSTYLDLEVPLQVRDVDLGPGESIGTSPLPDGKGTRLSAHLSPRSSLALSWTDRASSGSPLPPLLTAQVEMAMDADSESMTTRSAWVIRCVRGVARRLEIQLDPADVARQVKLDDQFIAAGIEGNVLTIPLGEPLRPGDTRRLLIETRRAFPPGESRIFGFNGFPLASSAEQTGAIGITQAANLWLNITATQGLRRIDPRELPPELRTRPGTSIAFQFLDQPFKLALGVESSPPLYRSEASTRVTLEAEIARIETTLDIQRVRGRLFDVRVAIPPGLELLSVGPPELVESATPAPAAAEPAKDGISPPSGQILKIQLTATARDQRAFLLRFGGQQRIGPDNDVKFKLFTPRDGAATSSTVSLFADRDVTFEVARASGKADGASEPDFRPQTAEERGSGGPRLGHGDRIPIAVLTSQLNPSHLQGRLVRHPVSVSHDAKVRAQVFPGWVEVRQENALKVRFGSVSSLTVKVPTAQADLWQVQARESVRREEIAPAGADGQPARYRLLFDPPIAEASTLGFGFRLPIDPPLGDAGEIKGTVSCVQIEEAALGTFAVELTAAHGIKTAVNSTDWSGPADSDGDLADPGTPPRYRPVKPAAVQAGMPFTARRIDQVALPQLVAPRALLRTVLGPGVAARTHAWYWIESHSAQVSFTLPEAAQWIRARVDGRPADQVERSPDGGGYRLTFPPESQSKPVLMEIEYQAGGGSAERSWGPPELQAGAVVLQSLWQFQIPWNQALVGVPRGWSDENQWYWDLYVWKRKPWKVFTKLVAWVAGGPLQAASLDEVPGEDQDDSHAYLFGRSGPPIGLKPWVVSRAWLVAVCSGSVLALGLGLMFAKTGFRVIWLTVAAAGLLAMVMAHPSVILLIVQSSLSGVVLALMGLLIQRIVEGVRTGGSQRSGPVPAGGATSEATPAGVGSDDSTAIRVRASSTMDYVSPLSFSTDPESARSSRLGPTGR